MRSTILQIRRMIPREFYRRGTHLTCMSRALFRRLAMILIANIAVLCWISVLPCLVWATDGVDPEADKILRAMSDFMGKLPAFAAEADIDTEIVDHDGQKLQLSSSATIILKRPNHFFVSRKGAIAHVDFIFDGKTLTIFGHNLNVYFQKDLPGGTDAAIDALHDGIGLDTPGADLLLTDTHGNLSEGVSSSAYWGTTYVHGVECHYLAFREPHVDWQLWVSAEGDPLPMKYVITTKWITGAPQYAVRFRDWDTAPTVEGGHFDFTVPKGAK